MKKRVGIFLIILALALTGYFLYPFKKSSSDDIQSIIPETSLIVVHTDNLSESFKILQEKQWFEAALSAPLVSDLMAGIERLDSLQNAGILKSKLTNQEFWVSLHSTSNDALSPLFVTRSNAFEWQISNISTILEQSLETSVSIQGQEFNGRTINLLKTGETELAFLIEGPYLAFSRSTLLLEDVVRALQDESHRLFPNKQNIASAGDFQVSVNVDRLSELKSVFFKRPDMVDEGLDLPKKLILEVDIEDSRISFSGTGTLEEGPTSSSPSKLFAKNLIPKSSGGFSWKPITFQQTPWSELILPAICTIDLGDMSDQEEVRPVYVLMTSDTLKLGEELRKTAETFLAASDSSIYKERFIDFEIGYIADENFMSRQLIGMGAPYYTFFQDMLLVSGSLDALKAVLVDFDNEETWGRSIESRRILDDLVQETDYTYIKDFAFATDPLKRNLKPKWSDFFSENPELLDVLNLFRLQLNNTSSQLLVSGGLSLRETFKVEGRTKTSENLPIGLLANVFADSTLITKPFVVRNHNNSSLEVVFQDAANNLYLTSRQGEVIWKRALSGRVLGDIHQIDFYNNKKLQYLAFTDSLIYLIDRNGNAVDGFPKSHTSQLPFEGTKVIDYDNSKRYRYLSTDRRGNLNLFDKEGELLEGWNPLKMGGSLLGIPFHVRVRGRDCFVVVERGGRIHLLNRRGDAYNGFPLELGQSLSGNVALTRGANFTQTLVSFISEQGELVQVNLDGKVVFRKQLLRTSRADEFTLAYDALKTTFSIVRNDGKTLTFFNSKGDERFSIDYPNSRDIEVDFYNFRNGREVFVIRDLREEVMRLVNRNGEFLTDIIPTKERISILYYHNRLEYEVFVNFADQMNVYAVKPL